VSGNSAAPRRPSPGRQPAKKRGGLTARERAFAHHYVASHNATEAAGAAGYKVGPGLKVTGARLLTRANVAELIAELERKHLAAVDSRAEEVLAELHHLGLARLSRLQNDDGTLKPRSEWPEREQAALTKLRVKEILGPATAMSDTGELVQTVVGRVVTAEMGSKLGALQTLAEHHGLVKRKLEVEHTVKLEQLILLARKMRELKRAASSAAAGGPRAASEAEQRGGPGVAGFRVAAKGGR
jgi:phage terminase small subunit